MPRLTAAEVKEALLERIEELAPYLFPHGRRAGTHWCIGDITGAPGDSFKICIVGSNAGLWGDFASGEKHSRSLLNLWMHARQINFAAALAEAKAWLGQSFLQPVRKTQPVSPRERQKPSLPMMRRGTAAELETLARLRNVDVAACILADSAALLRFATWKRKPAWIVTDDERLNGQARRLDGRTWEHLPDNPKAQTLPGSWGKWPIGAKTGAKYPAFILCEGGPDLVAGLHCIHVAGREADCFPIAMLGASMPIHPDALEIFTGRRVRIMPHLDAPGRAAAERWAAQLATVGADVDCADFTGLRKADGSPIEDLNDCTSVHPDDAKELEDLLPEP